MTLVVTLACPSRRSRPTSTELLRFLGVAADIGGEAQEAREGLRYAIWSMLELQKRLTTLAQPHVCRDPIDPDVASTARGADGEITRQRNEAFADLLVFAMSCDVTRVFTYLFSSAACHGSYADAGLDNVTFHEDYGHRKSPRGVAEAGFQLCEEPA